MYADVSAEANWVGSGTWSLVLWFSWDAPHEPASKLGLAWLAEKPSIFSSLWIRLK